MPNKNNCPRNQKKVTDDCKTCQWYHKHTLLCRQDKVVMRCMKGMYWQIKGVK